MGRGGMTPWCTMDQTSPPAGEVPVSGSIDRARPDLWHPVPERLSILLGVVPIANLTQIDSLLVVPQVTIGYDFASK